MGEDIDEIRLAIVVVLGVHFTSLSTFILLYTFNSF